MAASIEDPDTLIYGGVEVWRSTNGGVVFAKHQLLGRLLRRPATSCTPTSWASTSLPDRRVRRRRCGTCPPTAGSTRAATRVASVLNLSLPGLGVSQYYSTHTSADDTNLIVAGAQDQGYQRGVYQAPGGAGSGPSTDFTQLISGDYGHLTSGDGTHDWLYSTYPGFILVHRGQTSRRSAPRLPRRREQPVAAAGGRRSARKTALLLLRRQALSLPAHGRIQLQLHPATRPRTSRRGRATSSPAWRSRPPIRSAPTRSPTPGQLYVSNDHGVTGPPPPAARRASTTSTATRSRSTRCDADEVAVAGAGYGSPAVLRSARRRPDLAAGVSGLPQTLVYDIVYARTERRPLPRPKPAPSTGIATGSGPTSWPTRRR